jgi:hypothetical protein
MNIQSGSKYSRILADTIEINHKNADLYHRKYFYPIIIRVVNKVKAH